MPPLMPFDPQSVDFGGISRYQPNLAAGGYTSTDYTRGILPSIDPATGFKPLGGLFGNSGLGLNIPTAQLALNGLGTLGSLWGAMKMAKVAKQQLNFTRASANANLANQTQSYNTQIEDRARSRGAVEGQTQGQVDDYIAKNSLQKRTV